METNCILIWLTLGAVDSLYFIFFHSKTEKWNDTVRDLIWMTGIDEDTIYLTSVIICFIFGFFYIPYRIIKKLFKIEEK